ncbi:MAG: adenylosuccinate synthase, partial [Akkermansiaceae bacterium]|nr:adenylosuccinate synthase [Akkermansiaceae bacterium]
VYETLPGWITDTSGCRSWNGLPSNARTYLERLAELSGAPVKYVGIGPDREQTILV